MTTTVEPGPSDTARAEATPIAWWMHPWVALLAVTAAFALAQRVAGSYAFVLAAPVLVASKPVVSKLAFLAGALAVIATGRWLPRARDGVHATLGFAWAACAYGLRCTLALLAVTLTVRAFARRLDPYLAAVLTMALLAIAMRFTGFVPPRGADVVSSATRWSVAASLGWACCRLVVYAFESGSARAHRGLLALLSYAPFGLLLAPGEPPMLSFMTYRAKRTRAELDTLGTSQLLRSGGKIVALALAVRALRTFFPTAGSLLSQPVAQWGLAPVLPIVFFLRISAVADLCTGLSNLAGYHAPDAFDWPFRARTPFGFWRSWNVPFVNFMRLVCIYPLARRRLSFGWILPAIFVVTIVMHAFEDWTADGPTMDPLGSLRAHLTGFAPMLLALGIGWLFERRQRAMGVLGILVTWVTVMTQMDTTALVGIYMAADETPAGAQIAPQPATTRHSLPSDRE